MSSAIIETWASQTTLTIPRYSLERAILHLDKIEALALIRAVYTCTVQEAQEIRDAIHKRWGLKTRNENQKRA